MNCEYNQLVARWNEIKNEVADMKPVVISFCVEHFQPGHPIPQEIRDFVRGMGALHGKVDLLNPQVDDNLAEKNEVLNNIREELQSRRQFLEQH
eukprot:TRINITY_DN2868_c0_g1_i16.p1 TRINITY_DN2868_c0_g1~~TRINITY_DN2868_c0_g1_i16.p1  ORF type:complete len:104 (-),score=16.43 TRINITY_DN2868_c0_g1_i16:71-352(-)